MRFRRDGSRRFSARTGPGSPPSSRRSRASCRRAAGTVRLGGRALSEIPRRRGRPCSRLSAAGLRTALSDSGAGSRPPGPHAVAHGVRRALRPRPRGRRRGALRDGRRHARGHRSRRDEAAARGSASSSRGSWPVSPKFSSSTSRPRISIRATGSSSSTRCGAARRREAPSSSPRTSSTSRLRARTTRCFSRAGRVLAAGGIEDTLTEPLLSALFGVSACVTPGAGGRPLVSIGPARAR